MSDEELKRLLGGIETPDADLTAPVLGALRARGRKRRFSTFHVLAAALVGAAVLLGARQFYAYIAIGADGSIEEAQVAASSEAPAGEMEESPGPNFWPEEETPLELYLSIDPQGCYAYGFPGTQEPLSLTEMWELIADAKLSLPFPKSFPEGFRDAGGGAYFSIPPEVLDMDIPAECLDGGNGFYFQKLEFPELILQYPDWYTLWLTDGDRSISFDVRLRREAEKTIASGSAKSERVKAAGLDAVYIEEPPDAFSPLGTRKVFLTGKIPKTPYITPSRLGAEEREARGISMIEDRRKKVSFYRYYSCTIETEGVDRETLLAFAESIVFPEPGDAPPAFPERAEEEDG